MKQRTLKLYRLENGRHAVADRFGKVVCIRETASDAEAAGRHLGVACLSIYLDNLVKSEFLKEI